jgi:hypothetical protein
VCTKGLNIGGVNASGENVTSDKSANLCYEDKDSGVMKCLSDFYYNINQDKTNSNTPDYWIKTTNSDTDCVQSTDDNKLCCPGFDATACGTEPGQNNYNYNKNNLIINNSCFIGKNNCLNNTHKIDDQLSNPSLPIPRCTTYQYADGKCPVIKGIETKDACKEEANRKFYSYHRGKSGNNKYCACEVNNENDNRSTEFINGKCYVTNPAPSGPCWLTQTHELDMYKDDGDCYENEDSCKTLTAASARSWFGEDGGANACFANA